MPVGPARREAKQRRLKPGWLTLNSCLWLLLVMTQGKQAAQAAALGGGKRRPRHRPRHAQAKPNQSVGQTVS